MTDVVQRIIRIPQARELTDRLSGLDALLTSRRWERAAIVYAYTTNEGPGGQNRKRPAPPKMTMREFSRQGFAGLTSNKTVERYRAAWVKAIDNGWAVPVEPGQSVELPDQPFPAWPYGFPGIDNGADGDWSEVLRSGDPAALAEAERAYLDASVIQPEDIEEERAARRPRGVPRPMEERVLAHFHDALNSIRKLMDAATEQDVSPELRRELVHQLTALRSQADEALSVLAGADELVPA